MESKINNLFPIKDLHGKPSYRKYQKEAIMDAANILFEKDRKFVAIDGPVGCGKSAINVALARLSNSFNDNGSIYITPITSLQDQIMNEEWGGMRSAKGKSNYLCNGCGLDNTDYDCSYDGSKVTTCNTCDRRNYVGGNRDTRAIMGDIKYIHEKFRDQKIIINSKTAFDSQGDFEEFISKVQKHLDEKYELLKNSVGNEDVEIKRIEAVELLCCKMGPHECPVMSHRLRARYCEVAVLNPDIFFHINKKAPVFSNLSSMVFDECQQIEGVINRIFRVKLPIKLLKDIWGIDLFNIYEIDDEIAALELFRKAVDDKLTPIAAMYKTIKALGDVMASWNTNTFMCIKDRGRLVAQFRAGVELHKTYYMVQFLQSVFLGDERICPEALKNSYDPVRKFFLNKCEEFKCSQSNIEWFTDIYTSFMLYYKQYIDRDKLSYSKVWNNVNDINSHACASPDIVFAEHFCKFGRDIAGLVETVQSLNEITGNDVIYVVKKSVEMKRMACENMSSFFQYFKGNEYALNENEPYFDIFPVAINKIMNFFFYSKAKKIILSSGTWVMPQRLFNIYGLPKDCDLLRIQTTFDRTNRKVFVASNSKMTDFSAKDDNGYVYKTIDGTKKFIHEFNYILGYLREYIQKNHSMNANIVVHCHTFDIANKIAMHIPNMSNKFIIHIPEYYGIIKNVINGYNTIPKTKVQMLDEFFSHPNEGLTLISPSVSEGIDFKHNIARGQIILKRPTPNIGDPYIKTKMYGSKVLGIPADPNYFDATILTTIVQQYGRVVRASDDWGYTIILDQSISPILKSLLHRSNIFNRNLWNIDYFLNAIQYYFDNNGFPIFKWLK